MTIEFVGGTAACLYLQIVVTTTATFSGGALDPGLRNTTAGDSKNDLPRSSIHRASSAFFGVFRACCALLSGRPTACTLLRGRGLAAPCATHEADILPGGQEDIQWSIHNSKRRGLMAQQLAQGAVQTSPGEVPASAAGPTNAVGFDRLRSLLRRSGGSNKGQAAATEGDAVAMESGDLEGQRPQEPAAVAALVSDACMPAALDQLDGPLHLASGLGSLERVRACLAAGHDVDARGAFNFTPLFWAAQAGNLGAVRELLARGALVDSRDCYGTTPLVLATVAGNTEVVRELLSHSAHPDAPGSTASPLICATSAGNVVLVEALLSHGACTERRQPDGRTALHVAASRGRAPIVQLLLGRGCCLDAQDAHSFTPLHYAAGHGHLEVVEMLHGAGASMSVQDGNALTPLHLAAGTPAAL